MKDSAKLIKQQLAMEALREKEEYQNQLRKNKDLVKMEELLARENLAPIVQKYVIWNNDLDVARLMMKYGRTFSGYLNNLIKTQATPEMKAILNLL